MAAARISQCIKSLVSERAGTLPAPGSDLLATAVTPDNTDATLSVDFAPTITGVLTVTFTLNGTTTTANAYGGATLKADGFYPFEVKVTDLEAVNFQYSASPGSFRLIVREV